MLLLLHLQRVMHVKQPTAADASAAVRESIPTMLLMRIACAQPKTSESGHLGGMSALENADFTGIHFSLRANHGSKLQTAPALLLLPCRHCSKK